MRVEAKFGNAERNFHLAHAVLIYEEQGSSSAAAASIHEVDLVHGRPVLKAGQPVTVAGVEALAESLGRKLENHLLPERILSISLSQMTWWCPARRRRIWFKPSGSDKDVNEGLRKLNGRFVMHPPLFFAANRGLRVFALAENKRPVADTPLYVAPYYNCDANGSLCKGSAHFPDIATPSLIEKFEAGFFDSAFSHSNYGHKLTRHPDSHLGLWREMQTAKVFPRKYLQPYNSTKLGSWLKHQTNL
ncbi:MAG TPA: PRTRC system protein B [Verrucomicrobiae bacterium]|jgi:PRTRC genetic system protein B|nr:PRTRC system protein B [Verrucomicrobiae bacterium]